MPGCGVELSLSDTIISDESAVPFFLWGYPWQLWGSVEASLGMLPVQPLKAIDNSPLLCALCLA
jgi:hypothetical protein